MLVLNSKEKESFNVVKDLPESRVTFMFRDDGDTEEIRNDKTSSGYMFVNFVVLYAITDTTCMSNANRTTVKRRQLSRPLRKMETSQKLFPS